MLDGDIPLVVLINKSSASASEIVSGVLQDLDRGVIMGQRSFGKGLVQNTLSLGYNNNMKLTTAKYYIPSGRCIQGKEYKDGEPLDIPDDQRGVFYTRNKRKVLDGGGITPDIILKNPKKPSLIKALESQYIIFDFVNEYTMTLDTITSPKDYRFKDYDKFKAFVQKRNFTYTNEAEKLLKKLSENPDVSEGKLSETLNSLETSLMTQKTNELDRYQEQIVRLIEADIVSRYHFQKGKIQQRLDTDPELDAAITLLKDQKKYKKILGGK